VNLTAKRQWEISAARVCMAATALIDSLDQHHPTMPVQTLRDAIRDERIAFERWKLSVTTSARADS
jgi:hypothetical protein